MNKAILNFYIICIFMKYYFGTCQPLGACFPKDFSSRYQISIKLQHSHIFQQSRNFHSMLFTKITWIISFLKSSRFLSQVLPVALLPTFGI